MANSRNTFSDPRTVLDILIGWNHSSEFPQRNCISTMRKIKPNENHEVGILSRRNLLVTTHMMYCISCGTTGIWHVSKSRAQFDCTAHLNVTK
ncbi:MAG TPA: hypothetical protein VIY48_20840, partial [Candidatus Paceibacterota bacterium]